MELEARELGAEAMEPTAGPGREWGRVLDLILPILGVYAGQFLVRSIPKASALGLAVIITSVVLLVLRLRPKTAGRPADGVQILLGFLLGLPLALDPESWKEFNPAWQEIMLWLLSCAFVILAVVKLEPQHIELDLPAPSRLTWKELLVIVLLFVGALALRVPGIETIPLGVDPDEASLALATADAASGAANDPFGTGWATHPTLQFFLNATFVKAFGRTFLAMRLPWAVAGSLMVVTLYLLARVGYGGRVALLAGVLAIASNAAVHFSRLGINNMSDALFMTWTLAALWIAGATGSPWSYSLAGVGLGLGQYFYFGNRAIPFVVAAVLLVWIAADRRGVLRSWRLILGGVLVGLVVVQPLLGHWLRHPGSISEHLFLTIPFSTHIAEEAKNLNVPVIAIWGRQIRDSLLVFTTSIDQGSFYHPGIPMLHPLQAPLFLVGLLAIFGRWRRPFNQGLLAWIGIVLLLGSVLITDPAAFHRLLGVLPAAILVVAIGIDAAATLLARYVSLSTRAASGIAAAVVAIVAVVDVYFYFRIYNVQQAYKPPTQEAVSIAALEYERLGGQGSFVLLTREGVDLTDGKIYHTPIAFVAGTAFRGGSAAVIDSLDDSQPLYFYVLPDMAAEALPGLMSRFPGGTLKEYHRRPDGLPIMTRYATGSATIPDWRW